MIDLHLKYNYFYQKYKHTILFNKNLILAGVAAFFAGAIFAQIYSEQGRTNNNDLLNALATLSVEYGVYIPLFAVLFYLDNRHRYVHPMTGQKDYVQIRTDIKKLFAAFSISELIYSVCKILVQYYLLQRNIEAYQASMLAAIVAWLVFLVCINSSIKAVKLFKKSNK
jgi:Kef-type K+ transport system membrane component KefB